MYALLPFQAAGGMNVITTRLPAAVGGVLTVLLTYYVGARLFGRGTGMIAALLLAIAPWHIQQSRWGHEATLTPLLIILPVAALLWSNLPLVDGEQRGPRPLIAGLAGALAGICCYGYPAVRVFLPLFLMAAVMVTIRAWYRLIRTRRGALAVVLLAVSWGATFGPLAWKHLTDARIGKRGAMTRVWNPADPLVLKLGKCLQRYPGHFESDFLFVNGDPEEMQHPPYGGEFPYFMLPLLLIGLAVVARTFERSRAARVLTVWLLLYPVSDCISTAAGMHALRSLPGVCALVLLAALGAARAGSWLWQRRRIATGLAAVLAAGVGGIWTVQFARVYFEDYPRRDEVYAQFQTALVEACQWLSPHANEADAIFCTTSGFNIPYVTTLVALNYDPRDWFSQPRKMTRHNEWEAYWRCGKLYFMYGDVYKPSLRALQRNRRDDHVYFIIRPGEIDAGPPLYEVHGPDGQPCLWICERTE
jgi:4-amino-4-deoxy-L-arabinose transferase-like glycosyltransferase